MNIFINDILLHLSESHLWFLRLDGQAGNHYVTHRMTCHNPPPQFKIDACVHMHSNGAVDGTDDWETAEEDDR